MARGRHSHRGNQWNTHKGNFCTRHRGMSHNDSNANREVVCLYCGKSGHIARDCFKKINNDSNNRYEKHNGNYVRKDTPDVNGFRNLRLFISENALYVETDDKNEWFIDSGASAHMSYNRDWYDEYYKRSDGTHIYLGDKRSHKFIGYEVISVNIPNGQFKQIHNVMYVPSIKKNLIYVSAITDNI